jgi:hypothetical protein
MDSHNDHHGHGHDQQSYSSSSKFVDSMCSLIKQRYGDTCNEIGSIMLKEIKKNRPVKFFLYGSSTTFTIS